MKNTFSLPVIILLSMFFCCRSSVLFSQNLSLDADAFPVFIKPKSTKDDAEFKLGAGLGLTMLLTKKTKTNFSFSGGLSTGRLWFKEQGITINWPSDIINGTKSVYDRKFMLNEIGFLAMASKVISKKKIVFSPTAGFGYSWFIGNEKYELLKGSGERIMGKEGLLGKSFNAHAGLGITYKFSERKSLGIRPVFSYRFGDIATNGTPLLGTPNFQPHTLAFDIKFISLFFKNKPATDTKE